ncbi:MAG TPA: serine/threonine protein kinase [Candidatus Hydrogenedentes bacterium]|nr:serine/threonine protein kinase [Candidatus Hydrogenedentota bacterium]HIJ74504.1 serine/threonine protein kinase [Candidatus Hydrogenedentota bacterium]
MSQDLGLPDKAQLYHYKMERILGRGGSGTVYRAIDTKKGGVVAIKLFHSTFFRNRLHLRDYAKSVKKFRKFSHNNVVRIFDFINGDEGICLVEEFVDGPSLKWYVGNRPWNLQERLVIVAQVCNGLQYIHEKGFVHHDLKPSNVLFTRRGLAKISDYSLSGSSNVLALLDPGAHEQVTPMFVAPELIQKERATPQSDIYSLGVTLYLLFTERVPFEVDNLHELYDRHLHTTPDPPSQVNPKCPYDLSDIIMRMMDKKPENRFENCDQLRIALADIGRSRI